MNQDVTAPANVRGAQSGVFLTDATSEAMFCKPVRAALHKLRTSELGALSRTWDPSTQANTTLLQNMRMVISEVVSTFNQTFTAHPAAVLQISGITNVQFVLHGFELGGHLHSEATYTPNRPELAAEELPLTTLERFVRALSEWKGLLAPDHFDAMARHVNRLLSDQEELDEDNITPSPNSFDDMLSFLSGQPWDRAPAVGLNRRGQFSVSWGKSRPKVDVTLTFLGEGSIKWYVYGLGRKSTSSAAGTSDRPDLTTILSRLGCDDWMAR